MQTHLIPHLFRKDFRHALLPLILWFVLLLIQGALIGTGYSTGTLDMGKQMIYTAIGLLIPLLQGIVTLVLVPLVVQDEPLVGSTAHWLTRPISRSTLLAEKILFFGILIVLPPILINLVVFAVNGVQAGDMLASVPQFLITGWWGVASLMLLACLTSSFGRFAIWLASIGIVMIVMSYIIQFWRFFHQDSAALIMETTDLTLPLSRSIVASVFALVVATALVARQYLSRKTKEVVILTVVGFCVMIGLQNYWPVNFLQAKAKPAKAAAFAKDEVKLTLNPDSISSRDGVQIRSTGDLKTVIEGTFSVEGLPAGYQLLVQQTDAKWQLSNGEKLESTDFNFNTGRIWSAPALNRILNGPHVVNQPDLGTSLVATIFKLDREKYRKFRDLSGQYSATIKMKVQKYVTAGEMPVRNGEHIDNGSNHITIVSVLRQTEGYRLILRDRTVNLWFSGDHGAVLSYIAAMTGGQTSNYLLVNRARGEAFIPQEQYDPAFAAIFQGSTPLVNRTVPVEFLARDGQPAIDDAWMAGATLVRVEKVDEGEYSTKVKAENVPVSRRKD